MSSDDIVDIDAIDRAMPHETCLVYTPYRQFLQVQDIQPDNQPIGFFGRVTSRGRLDLATIMGFQLEEHEKRVQVNRSLREYAQPAEATLHYKLDGGIYVLNEKRLGDIIVGCQMGLAVDQFIEKNYGAPLLNLIRELIPELPKS